MPLTVKEIKNAKPGRHSDGKGLYLLVKPSGSMSWVLRVQYQGARRDFGLGTAIVEPINVNLPVEKLKMLTLADAREKARMGRALAKAGINPTAHWREREQEGEKPTPFKEMAELCHREAKGGWRNGKHKEEWLGSLQRYAFDELGAMSVEDIDAAAIQKVLLPMWLTVPETGRRVKQRIGVVLDKAHAKGLRSTEAPMRAVNQLMRGIKQPKPGNFPSMPYKDLPAFMAKLGAGDFSTGRWALQFLILTGARSGEIRHAQWKDMHLEAAEWRVPPEKAKAEKLHIVPLVPAAVEILKRMQLVFGDDPESFVFPGTKKAMSDATMAKVLRKEGGAAYSVHGFRSTFRDWAADNGFNDSWAEAAIAHANPNKTEAAYRRTSFLELRRDRLMPAWAAFALADNSKVVSLAERRA
jgi:integrase